MAKIETAKAASIPVKRIISSIPVNSKPNLSSFTALAPNITGIERKKEYSAAIYRDVPRIIAPRIVAPERDVPGIKDNT